MRHSSSGTPFLPFFTISDFEKRHEKINAPPSLPPRADPPPQLRRAKIRYNAGIVPTYALCSIDNGTLLVSLCCLTGISTRVAYFDFVDGIDKSQDRYSTLLTHLHAYHILALDNYVCSAIPAPHRG